MSDEDKSLDEQLGETEWALIIGDDGSLKGLFIPAGKEEEDAPYAIQYIMTHYFGFDFDDDDEDDTEEKVLH